MPEIFGFHPEKTMPPRVSSEVRDVVNAYVSSDWNRFELIVKKILQELKSNNSNKWTSDLEIAERILTGKLRNSNIEHNKNVIEKVSIAVGVVRDRLREQIKEAKMLQEDDIDRSGIDPEEDSEIS